MIYNINQIATVADCDALLAIANIELSMLNHNKYMEEWQYNNVTSGTASIDAELSAVVAEKTVLESVITTLADGPIKTQMDGKIFRLGYKERILNERRGKSGLLALIQKQYAISCIEKEISENGNYVSLITARKAEL